jgi:hypothetical protein
MVNRVNYVLTVLSKNPPFAVLPGTTYKGDGCARPESPGVSARVSEAYDWIQSMICCHSSNPPADCGTVVDGIDCPNDLYFGPDVGSWDDDGWVDDAFIGDDGVTLVDGDEEGDDETRF